MSAKRSVFVVATDTATLADEQEFAADAKPAIHKALNACDGIVMVEVYGTGKGAIQVDVVTRQHNQADTAAIALRRSLTAADYQVLDEEPRVRINTSVPRVTAKKTGVAVKRATAATPTRQDVRTTVIVEVRTVVFTGTAEQIARMMRYLGTLTGVRIEDPPD